jgi:hypothetical protein
MPEDRAADRFYQAEMVPRLTGLRRGIRLDVAKPDGDDRYVAVSFAGIYALVVWFDGGESLTVALPPSGGPGFDEGAQKVRA